MIFCKRSIKKRWTDCSASTLRYDIQEEEQPLLPVLTSRIRNPGANGRIVESVIVNEAAIVVTDAKEVVIEMANVTAEIVNEAETDVEDQDLQVDDEVDHLTAAEKK